MSVENEQETTEQETATEQETVTEQTSEEGAGEGAGTGGEGEQESCTECATLQARVTELEGQLATATAGSLTDEQRTAFESFTALGMSAEQVNERLQALATAEGEVVRLKSEAVLGAAADGMGWDRAAFAFAAKSLPPVEERDGGFFVVKDGTATELDSYAQANLPPAIYAGLKSAKPAPKFPTNQEKGGQPPKSNPLKALANQYVLPSQRNKP